jgi:hypothetical protein
VLAFIGLQSGRPLQLLYLRYAYLLLGSGFARVSIRHAPDKLHVWVIASRYVEAGSALATWPLHMLAIQHLGEIDSQSHFAHMRLAYKKVGMREALALQAAPQQLYRSGLTNHLPHRLVNRLTAFSVVSSILSVPSLPPGLLQHLAMLVLGHLLGPFLNNRTHMLTSVNTSI